MNVGEAARRTGLSPKALRHYDAIGLVSPMRDASGYRAYSPDDLLRLRLVQRARGLGFSIDDCRNLRALYDSESRTNRAVKAVFGARLEEIDRTLAQLQSIRQVLDELIDGCAGDDGPDCFILDELVTESDRVADTHIAGQSRW